MDPKNLAPYLDLANHHANATPEDIEDICDKVKKYGFNAAFVNPYYVSFAKQKMVAGGVTVRDVELIKQATVGKIKIKVAGGVDTYAEAMALINAGAARIGTSKAVEIITS